MPRSLQVLSLSDLHSGDEGRRARFIDGLRASMLDIGFFALVDHGLDAGLIERAYAEVGRCFDRPLEARLADRRPDLSHQRGYTPVGMEHAKDHTAPDLKEFWQVGRERKAGEEATFVDNVWPVGMDGFRTTIQHLFLDLDRVAMDLLRATALALGREAAWLTTMAEGGNTIMRLIHYPPLGHDVLPGAVRSAEHEDINLITLLIGSTASGLQVKDHDGSWIDVPPGHQHIIVDAGDMLQNLTNGLVRSTTHRVVNPDTSDTSRYSMPFFVHPRYDVDLSPQPEFIDQTGGEARFPSLDARTYLHQRLREIGVEVD